jgi:parallel beta-helix repeat protein
VNVRVVRAHRRRRPGVGIAGALALTACAPFAAHAGPVSACSVTVASDAQVAAQHGFAALAPGSTVCIVPGTYAARLEIVGTTGTAAQPVTFEVRPATAPARFTGGMLVRGAAYVSVSGLTVSLDPTIGPWAAVILDKGTHDATVRGLTVQDSFVGVALGSADGPAGTGNSVVDNLVRGNWNTGIDVDTLSDGSAAAPNTVRRNRVLDNGGHGIEVNDANYIAILDNFVSGNSTGVHSVQQGGYSGIHLYASAASGASSPHGIRCSHDVIASNTVQGTLQRPASEPCRDGSGTGVCADGNGIQVDRFCNSNDVHSNVTRDNAGDGISLYGASDNDVYGNYARGDNQQADRRKLFPGPAEIAVSANGLPDGSAGGNRIHDNVAITTVNRLPAFYQSPNAGANTVGPRNTWQWAEEADPGRSWGPVYIGSTWYATAAGVDAATRTRGNVVGAQAR